MKCTDSNCGTDRGNPFRQRFVLYSSKAPVLEDRIEGLQQIWSNSRPSDLIEQKVVPGPHLHPSEVD
jgi:hypothetical protein